MAGTPRKMTLSRTFTEKASHKSLLPQVMKRSQTFNGSSSNEYSPVAVESSAHKIPGREEVLEFLVGMVSDKTGLHASQISHDNSFVNYGLSSIVVVEAAQRLSAFLGVQVAAIDVYHSRGASLNSQNWPYISLKLQILMLAVFKGSNPRDLVDFLKGLVSERTGLPVQEISTTENLVAYGIDSVGVVWAAQKLSVYLGVHVSAVDIFTATNISELATFADGLLRQEGKTTANNPKAENVNSHSQCVLPSALKRLAIGFIQLIGIVYAAALLIVPAYVTCLIPLRVSSAAAELLKVNYTKKPKVSVWSVDFVKWWTLYRARDFAITMLATHLRGTAFITWWYRLLGANIGKDVVLDSIDITDPSLVSIADEALVSEGATLESHQVKNGMLVLGPVRIGSRASIGPFAFLQMGTVLASEAVVPRSSQDRNRAILRKNNTTFRAKGIRLIISTDFFYISVLAMEMTGMPTWRQVQTHIWQLLGIYTVAMVSTLSAAIVYPLFTGLAKSMQVPQIHIFSDRAFLLFSLAGAFHWPPAILAALVALNEPAQILEVLTEILLQAKTLQLAFCVGCTYIAYGFMLSLITCVLKWCIVGKIKVKSEGFPVRISSSLGLRI
ncbi:hypothetical protein KI387_014641, partial [Taxus chinensis]